MLFKIQTYTLISLSLSKSDKGMYFFRKWGLKNNGLKSNHTLIMYTPVITKCLQNVKSVVDI